MMKTDDWKEYEDDGRTIADMSGVTHRSLFGVRPHSTDAAPPERQPLKTVKSEEYSLTREERWWAFLGMMKAVLLVGLCFAAGIALVILAFMYL